ncbi:hypothetical protein PIB30_036209 [Stylosanthes scabra]|uniref:Uncharacterized protein n=1 Tax=Stylosanthes scabra TaxID=79078 RepID=A0ABU6TEE9_9FABA|nr:hypothetical protein [Stylosanthes scabra]
MGSRVREHWAFYLWPYFKRIGPQGSIRNIALTREFRSLDLASEPMPSVLRQTFPLSLVDVSKGNNDFYWFLRGAVFEVSVDEEVLSQSSMDTSDMLLELRREMRLMKDGVSEEDYVIEVAGPSDRLPFQDAEDRTYFLWVYTELFTRLGVRLLFTDFQKELHVPPPRKGFMSFSAHQGRGLFYAFEESIQEFKWHYLKVLPFPGRRPFWLDDGAKPFPWVYWYPKVRECHITALDPFETLAFRFLQSFPVRLGKNLNFKCRWILDHSDAEVGRAYSEIWRSKAGLIVLGKRWWKPRWWALAPQGSSSGVTKSKKKPPVASTKKPISLEGEENVKEDPSANLRQKRRKRKLQESLPEDAALGADFLWEHEVSPLDRAFPAGINFRAALDSGLPQGSVREALRPVVPEQLLGTAQHYACKLTACLQVYILCWLENAFSAKLKMEKEIAAAKDQVAVLMAKRDFALTSLPLKAEVDSLTEQLRLAKGERLSALVRMSKVEEESKFQAVELQPCRSVLE